MIIKTESGKTIHISPRLFHYKRMRNGMYEFVIKVAVDENTTREDEKDICFAAYKYFEEGYYDGRFEVDTPENRRLVRDSKDPYLNDNCVPCVFDNYATNTRARVYDGCEHSSGILFWEQEW